MRCGAIGIYSNHRIAMYVRTEIRVHEPLNEPRTVAFRVRFFAFPAFPAFRTSARRESHRSNDGDDDKDARRDVEHDARRSSVEIWPGVDIRTPLLGCVPSTFNITKSVFYASSQCIKLVVTYKVQKYFLKNVTVTFFVIGEFGLRNERPLQHCRTSRASVGRPAPTRLG